MLTRILRYVKGYVRIRITGYSPERFLNLCKYKKIPVWGLLPGRNFYDMNITIAGMKKLKPILRKTGTNLRIIEKIGLPFFLFRHRKRKIFFAGAAGCVLLVYILSLFIWNIEISGNHVRTDETILAFLRKQDVHCGMPASSVDCAGIARMIRKEYDDVIWVSASLKGSKIQIDVKENSDSREIEEEEMTEEGTDLIAEKDGVIKEIVTRSGVPMVHAGDEVKTGDILVTEDSALLFINKDLVSVVTEDLTRVRHTVIDSSVINLDMINYTPDFQQIKGTVSSVRLDSLLPLAFSSSRSKLSGLIEGAKVFVNGKLITSNGYQVKEGDLISVRGLGKFRFEEAGKITKKNRISVTIQKYV